MLREIKEIPPGKIADAEISIIAIIFAKLTGLVMQLQSMIRLCSPQRPAGHVGEKVIIVAEYSKIFDERTIR